MIERQTQMEINFWMKLYFQREAHRNVNDIAIKKDGITLGQSRNIYLVILSQKNNASRNTQIKPDGGCIFR